jgi:Bifunctional DNA primase/polymerase, N-terminal/Primase C terminal 1 (PriCT-1)
MAFYPNSAPATLLKAALAWARNGKPVFPCKAGGKEPLTKRGHIDATTDPRKIHMWWKRWPNANIAVPTGRRSGVLVLDVDYPAGLNALEAEHGRLPETRTHSTGSGGMHYLFEYPDGFEIRNSASKLADGLDVRGEGGYIIVPPSRTTRPYEVLDALPLADTPPWLIETLIEPKRPAVKVRSITTATSVGSCGPPILQGSRDDTLARIAGRLHDGTRSLDDLTAELLEINARRCEPPLPDQQVLKVARSIHGREPCRAGGAPTEEFLEALAEIEQDLYRRDRESQWRGMGGKSERDAVAAAIRLGRRVGGELIPGGLRLSVSIREWALETAVSKRSMLDYYKNGQRKPGIISRLKLKGISRSDNADRRDSESGAIVLVRPTRARFHHSPTVLDSRGGGETLRAPRLRWSAPRFDRVGDEMVRSTIRRLGKGCGAVIDALEASGGTLAELELACALGVKRVRDMRRRYLERLEAAGVVECSAGIVSLTPEYLDALHRERVVAGEVAAEERDRGKYARERDAYRNRHRVKTAYHHANVGADGYIEDLSPVEKGECSRFSSLAIAISDYLDRYPHQAHQPAGWLGVTVWAEGFHPKLDNPSGQARAAIEALGGAAYLDRKLREAKVAA